MLAVDEQTLGMMIFSCLVCLSECDDEFKLSICVILYPALCLCERKEDVLRENSRPHLGQEKIELHLLTN